MCFDFFQEREIFQGLSQQALSACMISVETAAQLVTNLIRISLKQEVRKPLHFREGKVTENQTPQSVFPYMDSQSRHSVFFVALLEKSNIQLVLNKTPQRPCLTEFS